MNSLDRNLVSVIIPTRNRKERLARAIESARCQTWPHIEVIVVDDASNDETQNFLQCLCSIENRLKFIRNTISLGGAEARNKGVAIALGHYIAFLDDDDIWLPTKIERQVAILKNDPSVRAVSCWCMIESGSRRIKLRRLTSPTERQEILKQNHLGGASMCLTTKEALVTVGGFDSKLKSGQDWDLWIKLLALGKVQVVREPLVRYMQHHDKRISSNVKSVYFGRRQIYERYKREMAFDTRRSNLFELLYCRKVLLSIGNKRRFLGLWSLLNLTGLTDGSRFLYRYIRECLLK